MGTGAGNARNRGFTLLEVMVTSGLMVVLVGICYSLLNNTTLVVKKGYYREDVHYNVRTAANRISRDLRQALDYTIDPGGSKIKLTRSEKDSGGNEIIKHIIYSYDPVDLEIERSAQGTGSMSSPSPLASHIKSLTFVREGHTIIISITGEKTYIKEGERGFKLYDPEPYRCSLHTKVTPRLYRE